MSESRERKKQTRLALRIMGGIIGSIAGPVTILVLIARRIDTARGGPKPYFTIFAMLASFVISTVIVCVKANKYGDDYDKLIADEERGPPDQPDSYG